MSSIAIIGQGYMGNAHATAWASIGKTDSIKYICTTHPKEGSVLAASKARYISELEIILKDKDVEFVSVCSPTPTHRNIAIALLNAGKHVLLEKPIALTLPDAMAVADAASKSSGSLMIAQVVRFFLGYQKLRSAYDQGQLGTVLSVHARRLSPKPTWATWMSDESQSGGMLVDFSIHDFDQLNFYLGRPVDVFTMQSSPTGPAEITIRYENGGIGQVQSFMNNSVDVPFTSTIDLLGTKGLGHYEFSAVSATEESKDSISTSVNGVHVFSTGTNTFDQIDSDDPYGRQIAYFWQQATAGLPYDVSPTSAAITALQVALTAKQSLKEARVVSLS
ncbi:MAG TPA: Gfo/Idh/MocA family oxidoreductase [archaeon]|nr:Gfo/Idh/MocA family oxidoreductase [archaeon]